MGAVLQGYKVRLPIDQCTSVVVSVLEKYNVNIKVKGHIHFMAAALTAVADDEFYLLKAQKIGIEMCKQREIRINLLESVLSAYEFVCDPIEIRRKEETFYRHSLDYEEISKNLDLLGMLDEIKSLVEVEKSLFEKFPSTPISTHRPITAKNASAKLIYSVLEEHGVKLRLACKIIAAMILEVGAAEGSLDKLQKALYDKFRRES